MKKFILILFLVLAFSVPGFSLQANFNWVAVTTYSDGSAIPAATTVFYDIYRGTLANLSDAAKINSSGITAVSYSDTTIVTNKSYYYFLRAYVNPALPSANSNVINLTTLTPQAPGSFTGVIVP